MNNKRNVYLMYAIIFLQGFVFYGPVATLFRQARGLSMSKIFIIESISWILIILLEVPWGWFSDKFGYKKTLIVVNTLFFLSKIVFYLSHSFESFLLERIMVSIVLSGLSGCDTALIYGSIKESEIQKVFGKYNAFATFGFLIASVLSTFIVSVSIDYTALLTIFPYGVSVILTLFLKEVKDKSNDKTSIIKNFKIAFSDKSVFLFVFAIALVIEVVQVITVFLNQIQYIRSGIDPRYFGLIISGVQCVKLLSVKANIISRKFGNINAISILVIMIMFSSLLLIVTINPIISILCVLLIALSMSMISPIEIDVKNKFVKGCDRATLLSIYSMVGGLIASLGNIAIGKATEESLQHGLIVCVAMSVFAFLLLRLYSKVKGITRVRIESTHI